MLVSRDDSPSGGTRERGPGRGAGNPAPHVTAPDALTGDFLLARPIAVVARVSAPGRGSIERVEALTPYAVQRIVEDARTAGQAAELDVTVRGPVAPGIVARVREVFATLTARGVRVQVSVAPLAARTTRRRPAA